MNRANERRIVYETVVVGWVRVKVASSPVRRRRWRWQSPKHV